jgi:Tol biopolymer transport system component
VVIIVLAAAAAAAAVYFFVLRDDSNGGGGEATPTPVASSGSAAPTPGASGYLAAAVGRQGNVLGTVAADGAVKELATTLGPQIFQIAYSPDGKRIACIAGDWKRLELSVVDVADGTVQRVRIANPAIVAVDSIAWLGPESLLVAGFTAPPKSQGEDAELLVYDAVAGSAEPLKDSSGIALRGVSASASADGGKVAYVVYTDQKSDQYGLWTATERLNVLDRASGTVTQLGSSKAAFDVNARSFDDPLISPTGTAVIFRRAGSDVGTSYTVMDVNGTTLMPAKELLFPAGYAWDPSGTKVMFTGQSIKGAGNGAVAFFVFDTTVGGAATVVARYKKTVVQDLAWSPDGSTVAWAEWDTDKYRGGHLYLMSAEGGDSRRLSSWAMMPAWAPDAVMSPSPSPSPSASTLP